MCRTVSEVSGNHVTHIPSATTGDEGWDRFSFSIKLEDYRRKLEERQLLICIRFSVEGQEWWDSNNGLNYSFNFRRSSPKQRNRHSLPAAFNNRYSAESASITSLPGLRQNPKGSFAPSNKIAQAFGDRSLSSGSSRDWSFPSYTKGVAGGPKGPLPRSESPALSPPPVTAFRPPNPPDVHTHLNLKSYCAPSPPMSPPETSFSLNQPIVSSSPEHLSANDQETRMSIVGGHPATLSPPPTHERRSSWSGIQAGSWDSFAKVMDEMDAPYADTDGSSTPTATGHRSPLVSADESGDSPTPSSRPLSKKRSIGDLNSLRNGALGLMTPPSSSSPSPSPNVVPLPLEAEAEPMSPQISTSSTTGESSPLNTVSPNSPPDITTLHIEVDPSKQAPNDGHRLLNHNSYDAFLAKFCFFQSPRSTPNPEDLPMVRNNYVHVSGHSSPTGFPFYGSNTSHMPRDTPTPKAEYASANDAFRLYGVSESSGHQTPSAPRPSPGHSASESRSDVPTFEDGIARPANPPKDHSSSFPST